MKCEVVLFDDMVYYAAVMLMLTLRPHTSFGAFWGYLFYCSCDLLDILFECLSFVY